MTSMDPPAPQKFYILDFWRNAKIFPNNMLSKACLLEWFIKTKKEKINQQNSVQGGL